MLTKYDNEIRFEILSKSCNEAFARIAVAAFASQLDPTIEEIADIKTAVSEAVTTKGCFSSAARVFAGVK
jgi:stage II sporulation protein AB (anti-sigma F factor)